MRAGQAVADALASRGWSPVELAVHADIPDPATIRTFMAGESWPWLTTRSRIERALGLDAGILDRIAKGKVQRDSPSGLDPVEAAIQASPHLSRGQKLRLRGQYVDMIEGESDESSTA